MRILNKPSVSFTYFMQRTLNRERLKKNLFFMTIINFIWLLLRTGSKPSRITYPCQQAAAGNISISLSTFISPSIMSSFFSSLKTNLLKSKFFFLIIHISGVVTSGLFLKPQVEVVSQEILLSIDSKKATGLPASDIYVVNGRNVAHFPKLIEIMNSNDLFYMV